MSEGIELPPLDKESELLVMENGYFTYSSVRSFREAAEKRIAELESQQAVDREELRVAKRALEMAEGDNAQFWLDDARLEALKSRQQSNPAAAEGGR